MEKRKQLLINPFDQDLLFSECTTQQNKTNTLYSLIPQQIKTIFSDNGQTHQSLYKCLVNLHLYHKTDQLKELFQQIGADLNVWLSKSTPEEKSQYLLNALDKNVEQSIKKVNNQPNTYIANIATRRKSQKKYQPQKKHNDFDWLPLNTKNEMLKQKLKTKLVQTINEYKNEKKLREVLGKQLDQDEKIHLENQQIDIYKDQKDKFTYEWTQQDEQIFQQNIKNLKNKFLKTQFLKNCKRFKFITQLQLKTLALQQISRKLDKQNKTFLSRQFLLDKYFSSKQILTQKQIKFILKTSPFLSKCVDKKFIKSSIANIKYQDIDKMELQIAQEIIQKFQMIRNLVKNSRKIYKDQLNNSTKKKIHNFQTNFNLSRTQLFMNEEFQKHKVKIIRNITYKPQKKASLPQKPTISKKKLAQQPIQTYQINPKKIIWPIPLNNNHPPSGLFIQDCSQQLNQQYNQYEKDYLKTVLHQQNQPNKNKISNQTQGSMIKFYTGGPLKNQTSHLNSHQQTKITNTINAICSAFKTTQYQKKIQEKLNIIDLEQQSLTQNAPLTKNNKIQNQINSQQSNKKSKKSQPTNEDCIRVTNQTQKQIKIKLQQKQNLKNGIFVKKLLILAAQNSFIPLKSLNAKFTASQINALDSKGNTALFYATKHQNEDFIDYLLGMKADVNIKCTKGFTPLHNAFKTSSYSIICKCLSGTYPPNLNILNDDLKTPLAYCCQRVLQMLGLQDGVVQVISSSKLKFDNNSLLVKIQQSNSNDQLQMNVDFRRKSKCK